MTHYWRIRKRLPERFGQKCRVLAKGKLDSWLIEFEDGVKVVTARNFVRSIEVSKTQWIKAYKKLIAAKPEYAVAELVGRGATWYYAGTPLTDFMLRALIETRLTDALPGHAGVMKNGMARLPNHRDKWVVQSISQNGMKWRTSRIEALCDFLGRKGA